MPATQDLREQIASAYGFEQIQTLIDRAANVTTVQTVTCVNSSCGRRFPVEVWDAKNALEVAKFAVEQGYGKVPSAKPVEEVDFSGRDPLELSQPERASLFEKAVAALEGKAWPPSRGRTAAGS